MVIYSYNDHEIKVRKEETDGVGLFRLQGYICIKEKMVLPAEVGINGKFLNGELAGI